jgi:hypothetical protein
MRSQRTLLVLVLGLAAACGAWAQTTGTLRWPAPTTSLGLQVADAPWRTPCGSIALPCEGDAATLPLYLSATAPRSLSLQVSRSADASPFRGASSLPPNVSLLGRAGIAPDFGLGVYGRLGMVTTRSLSGARGDGGVTYGVGLSWDFSRRGSASVGWDTYDLRTIGGEARDVRATSLGLQWRY